MDYARVLVRTVVRAFYETEHVVLVDALVTHNALSLSDLALVMDLGKQIKAVQKLCGKLKEGGLVSVLARQETRQGAQKPITKEYYYIDYRRAIDATKYRIHMLDEKVKADAKPTTEKKDLFCKQCGSEYTILEALDHPDLLGSGSGFSCRRCRYSLEYRDQNGEDDEPQPAGDDTPAQFNRQFANLLSLLQQIDGTTVPAVTGESALADARPIIRDQTINPAAKTEVVDEQKVKPTAVRGITSGPEKIEVSFTTSAERSAAERAAEEERKAKIAAQNMLPTWHTHSTVTGEQTREMAQAQQPSRTETSTPAPGAGGGATPLAMSATAADEKDEADDKRDPALDAYFAALKAEQERVAKEEEDEDDEDEEEEDEDEEEFEDVGVASAAVSTPVPEQNGDIGTPSAKRVKIEEPNHVKMEGVGTSPMEPNDSPVKVKQEQKPAMRPAPTSTQGSAQGDESDADDDFEDAL
ncbi:hypothetical protein BDY21DRAFT_347663 [Lineolata rhizophorae]|uniref:HTH TFE/IIEalpha-type domain-containing protein n=1 Tax=Lineolata rhizophorae TaxID=578093 RepID=A0A6A6NXW5_9PEZI|nr:hypothetical protein BDY21DRAFT_347663 [Lineolata rhizophorae]